ncbi:hypothetical protein [Kribbella sindirgiensis]|uniref:Uncharacterized protein n=1 Tax=Kribbella sindirgiensis TaxID=1124744 RepID=A0A4R0IJF9_9ACTN|nr:hypothetical protein [Kribbella sindirgiensis]TCC32304.1 hypothetical protein E0H50_19075 [Kribbella sindirgiensis]
MSIRSLPAARGASRRSAADHDLHCLFDEITSARVADRQARGQRRPDTPSRRDTARLALSLVAYARALERYRLPVPPVIRDELRLRSGLPS